MALSLRRTLNGGRLLRGVLALLVGAASLVSFGVVQSAVSASDDLRIMPLGDSNTDGFKLPGGYRITLEDQIVATGAGFDFVGSRFNGGSLLDDLDHEGHVGITIDEIGAGFAGWFDANPADVVLLMVGTNDVKFDDPAVVDDAGAAADRLDALLRSMTSHAPDVDVIVSTIPPQGIFYGPTRANAYNALIPGVVDDLVADGRSVAMVDGNKVLKLSNLTDGLHLTAQGYAALAGAWFDGLNGRLVPPPPTTTTTTTVPSTTTTVPTTTTTVTTVPLPVGSLVDSDALERAVRTYRGSSSDDGGWRSGDARIESLGA